MGILTNLYTALDIYHIEMIKEKSHGIVHDGHHLIRWPFATDRSSEQVSPLSKGSFFNFVDKTRWVGGTGNVNSMQIFHHNIKGTLSPMSTWDG